MREILFKGKRIDNGEWVYGNYAFCDCYTKQKHYIFQNKPLEYAVDENTICQYTGLTDKNGNKIWENDIVKHYNNPNEPSRYVIGAIYWNEDNVRYERTSEYQHCKFSVLYDCVYEVIGNIFDNHELLEGGAE